MQIAHCRRRCARPAIGEEEGRDQGLSQPTFVAIGQPAGGAATAAVLLPMDEENSGNNVDGPALKADSTSVGFADGEMQLSSRHRVGACGAAGHPWL